MRLCLLTMPACAPLPRLTTWKICLSSSECHTVRYMFAFPKVPQPLAVNSAHKYLSIQWAQAQCSVVDQLHQLRALTSSACHANAPASTSVYQLHSFMGPICLSTAQLQPHPQPTHKFGKGTPQDAALMPARKPAAVPPASQLHAPLLSLFLDVVPRPLPLTHLLIGLAELGVDFQGVRQLLHPDPQR